ncbi:MAG: hypothetical protein AAF846_12920 [Chloroflexota bacterium]
MNSPTDCTLCKSDLRPIIIEAGFWKLVLNWNQRFLGSCFWTLKRHEESITRLSTVEWAELHSLLIKTTTAMDKCFHPDHYNYVFLQNQDRHVHMHILPRFATDRQDLEETFIDPDYPSHYAIPGRNHHLSQEKYTLIADAIAQAYPTD